MTSPYSPPESLSGYKSRPSRVRDLAHYLTLLPSLGFLVVGAAFLYMAAFVVSTGNPRWSYLVFAGLSSIMLGALGALAWWCAIEYAYLLLVGICLVWISLFPREDGNVIRVSSSIVGVLLLVWPIRVWIWGRPSVEQYPGRDHSGT